MSEDMSIEELRAKYEGALALLAKQPRARRAKASSPAENKAVYDSKMYRMYTHLKNQELAINKAKNHNALLESTLRNERDQRKAAQRIVAELRGILDRMIDTGSFTEAAEWLSKRR